nr:unnamed protein product [Digitaria exilis]
MPERRLPTTTPAVAGSRRHSRRLRRRCHLILLPAFAFALLCLAYLSFSSHANLPFHGRKMNWSLPKVERNDTNAIGSYAKKNVCFIMFVDELTLATLSSEGHMPDENGFIGLWRIVVVKNLPYKDMRRAGVDLVNNLFADVPEGSFTVRAHTAMSNLFSCLWFNEVNRFTSRDQLSFAYTYLKLRRTNPGKPFRLNMFKFSPYVARRSLANFPFPHVPLRPIVGKSSAIIRVPCLRRSVLRNKQPTATHRFLDETCASTARESGSPRHLWIPHGSSRRRRRERRSAEKDASYGITPPPEDAPPFASTRSIASSTARSWSTAAPRHAL